MSRSGSTYHFVVGADGPPARLDLFLSRQPALDAAALSRTRIRALIEQGCVRVAGVVARDPAAKVAAAAEIELTAPAPAPAEPAAEKIPLNIVHEDDALIVIDKPAGLVVHPAAGHRAGTLVNALIGHCGASLSGIGGVQRPGIVHRLDKDTSGLLVVAKTDAAHRGLSKLFADHGRTTDFAREYLAVVWGAPERTSGVVEAPIARHAHARERMTVARAGREAITHWRVEATYGADKAGKPIAALVRCRLETGRTHQIRVHMAHIGHPLIGDRVYGAGFRTKAAQLPEKARKAVESFPRQALHAARLALPHPVSGEFLDFASEPPADLRSLIRELACA